MHATPNRLRRERPRLTLLALGILAVATTHAGPAQAANAELFAPGASVTINGAIFTVATGDTGAGSGAIDAFLRTQETSTPKDGFQRGYNTDGSLEFDTKPNGCCSHAIQLGDVPTVTIGGIVYREFLLDVNEPSGGDELNLADSLIMLDELRFFVSASSMLTGYDDATDTLTLDDAGPGSGHPVVPAVAASWDMEDGGAVNGIDLDADTFDSGSGEIDLVALIPSDVFGVDETQYVYLYNAFQFADDYQNPTGGFEEWAVAQFAVTPPGEPPANVPEPGTLALAAVGVAALGWRRRR